MVLSDNDCSILKSFWDSSSVLNQETSKYANLSGKKVKLKTDGVKANYVNIEDESKINFILSKIKPLGIKSISLQEASIMRYIKGDYFGLHRDFPDYGYDRLNRTVIIQLSSSDDYVGGDLLVKGTAQPRELGSVISVMSNEPHEVTEVLQGERYSLAVFLLNRDILTKKSLL